MNINECILFDQQIYSSTQNVQRQLAQLLLMIQQQINKSQQSSDLDEQLTQMIALQENALQVKLWVGICNCLQY